MNWLALDIGGANLKAADGLGFALSDPFALWRHPEKLTVALRELIAKSPPADALVATMTGELADCFATKAEGVRLIVESLTAAVDGRATCIYLTDGRMAAPAVALQQPLLAAAANWHALARFVGRYAPRGLALLIDIGSTTSDLIPLVDGMPTAIGRTDPQRLLSGELVYTGVVRTPVCGIVATLPFGGKDCPLARELFATAYDAYLTTGDLPEDPQSRQTADGRAATRANARDRLARMVCADRSLFSDEDAQAAAAAIVAAQIASLTVAARQILLRLPQPPSTVIISGQGEFLARRLLAELSLTAEVISLRQRLGDDVSQSAPAHALAVIAREQQQC